MRPPWLAMIVRLMLSPMPIPCGLLLTKGSNSWSGATAVGMMTGALVGLLAGPEGMVIGAAAGSMMGASADLINLGVGADFLDEVGEHLSPGMVAVVAEMEETWVTPVDTRMEALGGTVYRRYRWDVEDDQIDRDIVAWNAELDELEAEMRETNEENEAKLQAKIDATRGKLEAAGDKAKAKLEAMKEESDAKIKAVEDQMATAKAERKAKLEERKAKIKADYEARSSKLKQAWELTKQAVTD